MEDNYSLLMQVLRQHYQDRPKVLDNALQLVNNYTDSSHSQIEYEMTLNGVYNILSGDLSPTILLYLLTTMPLPKCRQTSNETSMFMVLMRKMHARLPNNIRTVLVGCMNDGENEELVGKKAKIEDDNVIKNCEEINAVQNCVAKETMPRFVSSCKNLQDICAEYVVKNENVLKMLYDEKHELAWGLLGKNVFYGKNLERCYDFLKDVNKKRKWLRLAQCKDVPFDVMEEIYQGSKIFVQEKHLHKPFNADVLSASDVLKKAVINFVYSPLLS